ncbi:DUF2786 domain-containing protein [Streptomyces sp. NPDC050315]|uniref:DUF2786 domain-containing protein n=1 Tax=Streptomyces sp. NPDC050315 TaxID=3155039 RepID=UPI003415285D
MGNKGEGRGGRRESGAGNGAGAGAEETVARVLGAVRYAADGRPAEDAVEAGASALSADPAGPEAVSRALLTAAAATVRGCWEGGWHPADLVRLVRRAGTAPELAAALVADLIAAELRRYPAEELPPRWPAQLREAGAEVWWPDDGGYPDALARRRRTTRFDALCAVLEVLRILGRLPRVTPTGPMPGARATGTAYAGARPTGTAYAGARPASEPRVLGRIRGLLAKAESTAFPEEAEALSAKAQELMARHSVSEALLAGAAPADGPEALRIGVEGPYENAKALLLDAVATANRCQAVWSPDAAFTTLVGFAPDLDAAELLYTSLLVQATTAMNRAADTHHRRGGKSRRTKDFRQSFLAGYASRIRERLLDAADHVTAEATEEAPDLLPVLAARDLAVQERTGALFPETTAVRMRGVRDAEGLHQGAAAADRARLDRGGR